MNDIFSGAPVAWRAPSGVPYWWYSKEKETHELIFPWLHHEYCSWAPTHDGDDGVAQHGDHTTNRLRNVQPWFTVFDIGRPSYDQITPVKTEYPLTSITWPYRELIEVTCSFGVDTDQVLVLKCRCHFRLDLALMSDKLLETGQYCSFGSRLTVTQD